MNISYQKSVSISSLPFLKQTQYLSLYEKSKQVEYSFSSVKAFADQRRKVKPARKHVASRNPVKVLKTRDGVTDGLEYGDEEMEEEEEDTEKVNTFFRLSGNANENLLNNALVRFQFERNLPQNYLFRFFFSLSLMHHFCSRITTAVV